MSPEAWRQRLLQALSCVPRGSECPLQALPVEQVAGGRPRLSPRAAWPGMVSTAEGERGGLPAELAGLRPGS